MLPQQARMFSAEFADYLINTLQPDKLTLKKYKSDINNFLH